MLWFIKGDVFHDCRAAVWTDEELEASAALLRRFHDCTVGSELARNAEVVCHNDYGPWNPIWRDRHPVAIIDFDNAAPGSRVADLGYAVWKHLNLGTIELSVEEQRRRVRVMTESYGTSDREGLLVAIQDAQARMWTLIAAGSPSVRRERALRQTSDERRWLNDTGATLIS